MEWGARHSVTGSRQRPKVVRCASPKTPWPDCINWGLLLRLRMDMVLDHGGADGLPGQRGMPIVPGLNDSRLHYPPHITARDGSRHRPRRP